MYHENASIPNRKRIALARPAGENRVRSTPSGFVSHSCARTSTWFGPLRGNTIGEDVPTKNGFGPRRSSWSRAGAGGRAVGDQFVRDRKSQRSREHGLSGNAQWRRDKRDHRWIYNGQWDGRRRRGLHVRDRNGDHSRGHSTATVKVPVLPDVSHGSNESFSLQLTGVTSVIRPVPGLREAQIATGAGPSGVATGDLNGDGKRDLVVANQGSNTVSVYLNTTPKGAATPTFAPVGTFATGNSPDAVALGDFTGDGKLDIATANFTSNTVSVLLNETPAGSNVPVFAAHVDFATDTFPAGIAVADFNGDGKPDIVVTDSRSASVSVLLNTTPTGATTLSFAPKVDFGVGSFPYGVVVGDINGDGKPDIVTANENSYNVSVLLNTTPKGATTPSFAPQQNFATAVAGPVSVAIGDLNGDGKPDLVAIGSYVSILLNTTPTGSSTASFTPHLDITTGSQGAKSAVIADLNGDGLPDIAVTNPFYSRVTILLNQTAQIPHAQFRGPSALPDAV